MCLIAKICIHIYIYIYILFFFALPYFLGANNISIDPSLASWAEVQVAGARQVIARADATGHDQEIQIQVDGGAILSPKNPMC